MVYTRTHHRAHQWCDLPALDGEALHGNVQGDSFCPKLDRLVLAEYSILLFILLHNLLKVEGRFNTHITPHASARDKAISSVVIDAVVIIVVDTNIAKSVRSRHLSELQA